MKILSNEICNLSHGLNSLQSFESLDLTTAELKEFVLPISIITRPGYTSEKKVGFHPNFSSLISSLICSSPRMFSKYVNSFCDEFDYECKLLDIVNSDEYVDAVVSASNNLEVSVYLYSLLSKHREELRGFIDLLRTKRPVELERNFTDVWSLINGPLMYFISYFSIYNMDNYEPSITVLSDSSYDGSSANFSYTGSFNLRYGVTLPINYSDIINDSCQLMDVFSLDAALSKCINDLRKADNKLFSSYKMGDSLTNELLFDSVLYDLVYEGISREWGI